MKAIHAAANTIRHTPTEQLLDLWESTTENNDPNIYTVRGWLMDELSRRYPAAFDAWLDLDAPEDDQLRQYIEVNSMCHHCKKFRAECAGEKNHVFTGCVFRVRA